MNIDGSVALVTGANRGFGAALCRALLERGITTGTSALAHDATDKARLEFETNVLGPLAMSRAFAPILDMTAGVDAPESSPMSGGPTTGGIAPNWPMGAAFCRHAGPLAVELSPA